MKFIEVFFEKNKIKYVSDEPMKLHTTFRIGGNAKYLVYADSMDKLSALLKYCTQNEITPVIIGNGSNLLVNDDGIDNVVIKLTGDFCKIELIDETTVKAGAGVTLSALCRFALENELSGLEFAYGIPGSLGGAVFMNAGAYGGQMSDVLVKAEHIDFNSKFGSFSPDELKLGYRTSAYSCGDFIITGAIMKLQKGDKNTIGSYMNELLQRRKDKQPLDYPSAGSTFKRPEGYFAGALIENSNLKGTRCGGAMVSEKHAGFIINYDNATCKDVLDLIELCKSTVMDKYNVMLETEIKMM